MSLASATPESNQFRALLGRSFHCPQCHHLHHPDSWPARQCAYQAARLLRARYPPPTFSVDIKHYLARRAWYQYNGRFIPEQNLSVIPLFRALNALEIHAHPDPTMAELAGSAIDTHYRARYLLWREETFRDITLRTHNAQPLLTALTLLLPPPYPVGTPTGRLNVSPTLIPSLCAANEIHRIQDLLTDHPHTLSRAPDPLITLTIPTFSPHRGCHEYTSAVDRLKKLFSTPSLMKIYPQHQRDVRFDTYFLPDSLGLDPDFWASIVLQRRRLTFTTHPFQIEP